MSEKEYIGLRTEVPKVLQKVLPRHGISEIIENVSLDELVYFVAPYGCGKTMSVISWLNEKNKKAAWLSLDKGCDSASAFWVQLATAILKYAGRTEDAEKILCGAYAIEDPRAFLRETFIDVSPKTSDRVLVIDNFKCIKNKALLLEIKALINNMLGCWRIIIIGRNELPPIFNDFVLKKHLKLITLCELKFNLEETAEYFSMNGIEMKSIDLLQIYKETDGWTAALNALLSVPCKDAIRFDIHALAYVKDFFEIEVWEQIQDETIKEFLIKTAILEKITPSVSHYVCDIYETEKILRYLYVNGIFISKNDESNAYSYLRVFRTFLMDKLKETGIDINSLYLKAGWWLYDRDESVPALLCLYKANDKHGINMAFKKVRPADMGMERYLEAAYCLTTLNIEDLKEYPSVAVRIALLHFLTNNISEVRRIYEVVIKWLEPGVLSISPEEYIDFIWEVGWLRYVNPDENILFDDKFEEWANVEEYAPHLLESDRSRAAALRLPSLLRGARDFSTDIELAIKYYDTKIALNLSVVRDEDALHIMALIYAEIAYEREEFDKAEKIVKENMPKIERIKQTELYFVCTVLLVKISRATNDAKEVDKLTARLKKMIENNKHFYLQQNFHAFEQRNRLSNGIQGMTDIFFAENEPYMDTPYYYLLYRQITYVRALLSEGKYYEAEIMLGNLELLCCQYKRNMDLIEIKILRSIAAYGLLHEEEAMRYLTEALDAGRKNGLIRIFSDDAINIWPILNRRRKTDTDAYIKNVIISCKKMLLNKQPAIAPNGRTYEPLTTAEIRIIKLLPTGMTDEEIAISNKITKGTVKAHLRSIYAKLDVSNRIEAALIAQKIGLV